MVSVGERFLQRLGARIRAERERAGLSQEKLAELAGLHRTYVGGVERGERNLGLLNLIRIARALRIPTSVLISGIDSRRGR